MPVKGAWSSRRVTVLDIVPYALGTAYIHLPAAASPEEKFEQTLGMDKVGLSAGMPLGKDLCLKTGKRTPRPFQTENQGDAAPGVLDFFSIGTVGEHSRTKSLIQRWHETWFDQLKRHHSSRLLCAFTNKAKRVHIRPNS
jgi:hypothetical protein